jgi:uncharacterized protein
MSAPAVEPTISAVVKSHLNGLVIEGVATTPRPVEYPLPAGLYRIQDGKTTTMVSLDPMEAVFSLPLPLLLSHDRKAPVGEVYELRATPAALRFKAIIAAPGADGFDADLVRDVARRVQAGELLRVSVLNRSLHIYTHPARWRAVELSLVEEAANPDAVVERITLPDGITQDVTAPSPDDAAPFDLDAPDDGVPLRWLGSWRSDMDYTPGATVFRSDTLWTAVVPNAGVEPGKEGTADEPRAWKAVIRRPDLRPSARDRK